MATHTIHLGAWRRALASVPSLRPVVVAIAATGLVTLLPIGSSAAEPPPSLSQVAARVDQLNEDASRINEEYLQARLRVQAASTSLASVRARMDREQRALNATRRNIGAIASSAYRNGGFDESLQLLLAKDPTQFLNQSASLDQLARGQGTALRRAETASQRLAQDRIALNQKLGDLKDAQGSAADAQRRINAKLSEARGLLSRLTAAQRARYLAEQRRRAIAVVNSSRRALQGISFPRGGAASGRAGAAVAYARAQVGDRYVWGADGPGSFDCSGLTLAAWRAAGVYLPHQSGAQYSATSRVSRSELRPGDLVFFYSPISHVGMYIGGGLMVHAANPRDGVEVASLSGYWSGVYVGAGRP